MNTKTKVKYIYWVRFRYPPFAATRDLRCDFFFTSIGAIYTVFSKEQIGCAATRLWHLHVSDGTPYLSAKCEIRRAVLISKPQQNKAK